MDPSVSMSLTMLVTPLVWLGPPIPGIPAIQVMSTGLAKLLLSRARFLTKLSELCFYGDRMEMRCRVNIQP